MNIYDLPPIGEREAPHVCHHGAMPGRCLAPACENYLMHGSFRGIPFPPPKQAKREREASPEAGAKVYQFKAQLRSNCKACGTPIPPLRFRHGSEHCCAKCAHKGGPNAR